MGPLALARRSAHALAGVVIAAGAPGAAGCRSVVDPPLPGGAVRLAPPAVYARWWAMTEACAGLRRDVGEVAWYVVPGARAFANPGGSGEVRGYYSRPGSQLVLAGQYQLDGALVRHEMLHALLRTEAGHPRGYYLARCAGVVACDEACVSDAGPAPPAPAVAPVVPPSALVLRTELSPAAPGVLVDDGWMAITVSATNPVPGAVTVQFTRSSMPFGFGYVVLSEAGSVADAALRVLDPGLAVFAPGETKRQVFDLRVRAGPVPGAGSRFGDVSVSPGAYRIAGVLGSPEMEARSPAVAATFAP